MLRWLIGIISGEIICESSNWQHIQRLKITILPVGANWQLFRLERIAKCSYLILSTQNIKFYWFVMKRKTFLLPIWWYNRGLFPLGNKYFGVFVLNGLTKFKLINVNELSLFQSTCYSCLFLPHSTGVKCPIPHTIFFLFFFLFACEQKKGAIDIHSTTGCKQRCLDRKTENNNSGEEKKKSSMTVT